MRKEVIAEFRDLLDQGLHEQAYQAFLERHTEFMPREFVQNHGIHFRLVLRKLSFGADLASDFFFLSKSSDDWNCVFVELEKPTSRFFKDKSNEFHADFRHALEQVQSWRAWLTAPQNALLFTNTTVGMLRQPLGNNPCFFKFVLVHGRRAEYEGNEQRRSLVRAQERDDFKIVTYDSLLDHPHDDPLYVASKVKDGISILSDVFVSDMLFAYLDASQLEVTAALQAELSKSEHWISRTTDLDKFHLELALPHLRVRK